MTLEVPTPVIQKENQDNQPLLPNVSGPGETGQETECTAIFGDTAWGWFWPLLLIVAIGGLIYYKTKTAWPQALTSHPQAVGLQQTFYALNLSPYSLQYHADTPSSKSLK